MTRITLRSATLVARAVDDHSLLPAVQQFIDEHRLLNDHVAELRARRETGAVPKAEIKALSAAVAHQAKEVRPIALRTACEADVGIFWSKTCGCSVHPLCHSHL